jgi:hypothetical protein
MPKCKNSRQHVQRRCKLCLPLSKKQLKILLPLPLQNDKRTAAQVEEAKSSKKRKIRRHRSDYCGDCGQDDYTWSSDACPHPGFNARKVQKRRKDEVATYTDAKRDARPVDLGPGF